MIERERMDYDLIVIGGGSAGLTATAAAARLGARVLLIEKKALGGDCLYTGCVPSKTLIRTARLAHEMRHAARLGLADAAPAVDGARVMARVREAIARIERQDSPARFEAMGAEVKIGAPRFLDRDRLELGGTTLGARAFVLATGSRPSLPPIPGLADAGCLTNESVFTLSAIPKSLAVIGGGAVGLELGQALARLGARVSILEAEGRLLPKEDAECSMEMARRLEAEGLAIHTATTVHEVRRVGRPSGTGSPAAQGSPGKRKLLRCDKIQDIEVDEILVAVGRAPNVEGLGLDAAGVEHDRKRVSVDQHLRTSNPKVFAVGDVIGHLQFTHTAGYEAALAVRNALFPFGTRPDYRAIPWAIFTDPELARVGMTEEEARASNNEVEVFRANFSEVDRAITDGHESGFAKLLVVDGKLVGAHILGPHAGELIHVPALAMRRGLGVSTLASMSWVYPTLSEVVRKASQSRYEQLLESRGARRVASALMRLKG
jgi:pyruvate/2-oxoglutarate dehydrogenase complex dihydrolipoamide dehydrogenase (E3) component